MVAKISYGSNLYGALAYNQQKVDAGKGKILECNLVMTPADGNRAAPTVPAVKCPFRNPNRRRSGVPQKATGSRPTGGRNCR